MNSEILKNITLISPSFYDRHERLFRIEKGTLPPLSIYYLAGFIPKKYSITLIDETVQKVEFDKPTDLVGISSTTINIRRAYEIADEFRKRKVNTVLGGIHSSLLPEEALNHVDAVVVGEGEDSWQELLKDFNENKFKKIYENHKRNELSNLPIPRFDLLDFSKYLIPPFHNSPIIPVQTARGCPHNCDFCSVTKFWGKKIRYRPINDVVAEIEKHNSDIFFFTDDNLFANPSRAFELCKALEPLNIKFFCQIDTIIKGREKLFKALSNAGCFMTIIGLESLKEENLKSINKKFNKPESYSKLINLLHKNSISVYASIIVGLEGDNFENISGTVGFLNDNEVEIAAFFPLTPLPGTKLFDDLIEGGQLLDVEWWLHSLNGKEPGLVNYKNNPNTEYELSGAAMKSFYTIDSIGKRYKYFHLNKILPLMMNIQNREKMSILDNMCAV